MKPAQIYTYTVPASGSVRLMVEGSFIKILASTGPVQIGGDFGNLGPVLAGQGLRDTPSKSYTILDLSGATNVVRVLIADTGFIDDRVSGEVSVIDGGKSRTLANQAFGAYMNQGGVASRYSALQVWNPVGNLKNIVIESFLVVCPVQSFIDWGCNAAPLASGGAAAVSKLSNGASGTSQLRTDAAIGGFLAYYVGLTSIVANVPFLYKFNEPVVLRPGSGFLIECQTAATNLFATVEIYEEPV